MSSLLTASSSSPSLSSSRPSHPPHSTSLPNPHAFHPHSLSHSHAQSDSHPTSPTSGSPGSSRPALLTHPSDSSRRSIYGHGDWFRRGSLPRRLQRGLTMDTVQERGMVDAQERSLTDFADVPLDEKDVKKLPKKSRPYYEHLQVLHEHYLEVDGLLSGELPRDIVRSFQSSIGARRGTVGYGTTAEPPDKRQSRANGGGNRGDEEAGEGSPLLAAEDEEEDREEKRDRIASFAVNVNTIVNILLVAAKVVAVLYSSSISLTASLVDSALDLLSTFIILGTSWAIGSKTDAHKYPAGKRRFEPLGVLIFSVAMIASFLQVFIESFQRAFIMRSEAPPVDLSIIGIATMLATIGVKGVLWVWCSRIPSSGVQALAQDAENDVWLNLMSLAFPYIGTQVGWRLLDPIGGMVLSSYIIFNWIQTLLENFAKLSGKSASRDQITRVLYLVSRFNPVLEIGDVECYHIGDDLIVEIDVILPQSSSLHYAHDVGETIQCVLENLDGVLRAYVHCDYSSANPAQHTARNRPQGIPLHPSSEVETQASSGDSTGSATPRPRFLPVNGGLWTNTPAEESQAE